MQHASTSVATATTSTAAAPDRGNAEALGRALHEELLEEANDAIRAVFGLGPRRIYDIAEVIHRAAPEVDGVTFSVLVDVLGS